MKLSATKVSQHLDVSVPTINNWYRWYKSAKTKPVGMPDLPAYTQNGTHAPRYWDASDLPALEAFKAWLPKGRAGVMGEYTGRYNKKKAGK